MKNEKSWTAVKYSELFEPSVGAEIIILGDSRGLAGIDPQKFNDLALNVYNFAFNGASLDFVRDLYERILKKYYPRPNMILYQVHPDMFGSERLLEQDSEYFPQLFFVREMFRNSGRQKILFLNRFSIFKNRDSIFKLIQGSEDREKENVFTKGHVPMKGYGRVTRFAKERWLKSIRNDDLEEARAADLESLIQTWLADEIVLVLVQLPVYLESSYDRGKEYPKFNRLIKNIASKYGVLYLNYNGAMKTKSNENPIYFHDPEHLNEIGSQLFSTTLRRDLEDVFQRNF